MRESIIHKAKLNVLGFFLCGRPQDKDVISPWRQMEMLIYKCSNDAFESLKTAKHNVEGRRGAPLQCFGIFPSMKQLTGGRNFLIGLWDVFSPWNTSSLLTVLQGEIKQLIWIIRTTPLWILHLPRRISSCCGQRPRGIKDADIQPNSLSQNTDYPFPHLLVFFVADWH